MIKYKETELRLLTLDKALFHSCRKLGLSQRDIATKLSDKFHKIDYITYSQIKNA